MTDIKDRVALVTGGNAGIGRGIAQRFIEAGYRVAIIARNQTTLDQTAKELGTSCRAFKADITRRDEVLAAVDAVVKAWGKIHVLVNNSGIQSTIFTTTPIEEAERAFRETIDVNLTGPFLMTMAAAPHLVRPGGRIINISSIGAFLGGRTPGTPAYIASKNALNALTHSFARELGPQGITVNGIAPGLIETAMTAAWSEERRRQALVPIVMGRTGQPVDIAEAALYLASPEASFVTGEILNVNGGALFVH